MLDVAGTPEVRGEQLLLVRHAVVVGIGVFPHLVLVRFHRQDAVGTPRHHEPRKHQLVDEHAMMFVDAVVVLVLMDRNAPDRRDDVDAVQRLLVAAHLGHEHAAVSVEGDLSGRVDLRVGKHGFEVIAGRQPEALCLFLGPDGKDGRLRRQVRVGVRGILRVRRLEHAAAASRLRGSAGCAPAGAGAGVGACGVCVSPDSETQTMSVVTMPPLANRWTRFFNSIEADSQIELGNLRLKAEATTRQFEFVPSAFRRNAAAGVDFRLEAENISRTKTAPATARCAAPDTHSPRRIPRRAAASARQSDCLPRRTAGSAASPDRSGSRS